MTKLISLEAQNVKRLKAVRIDITNPVTIIGGENGQGKTTVLDCIEMTLGGKKSIPPRPIREGETSARIVLELDTLTVTRRFTPKESYLEVRAKDGAKYTSAQAVLDELYNNLSFDPVEFARMKPADQAATLRAVCGIDTAELDREFKQVFEERTGVNRDMKSAQAALDAMPKHEGVPAEPVSVTTMLQQVEDGRAQIRKLASILDEAEQAERRLQAAGDEVAKLEKELEYAKEMQRAEQARTEKFRAEVEVVKTTEATVTASVQALTRLISTAEETNQKARENAARAKQETVLCAAQEQSQALTDRLDGIAAQKQAMLKAAKYPVDGLSISDDGEVLFNGVPFEQASGAEKIRASAAIGLAMNPKLPILLIRDGSLLDENSMRMLTEFAEQHGAQILIERVGSADPLAVVIHDGEVQA